MDKKLLGIAESLKHFHNIFYGKEILVQTDHKIFAMKMQNIQANQFTVSTFSFLKIMAQRPSTTRVRKNVELMVSSSS